MVLEQGKAFFAVMNCSSFHQWMGALYHQWLQESHVCECFASEVEEEEVLEARECLFCHDWSSVECC